MSVNEALQQFHSAARCVKVRVQGQMLSSAPEAAERYKDMPTDARSTADALAAAFSPLRSRKVASLRQLISVQSATLATLARLLTRR